MRRRLRRGAWLAAACVATSLCAAAAAPPAGTLPSFDRVMTLASPKSVNDIAMTDHTGAPRRLGDFAGHPVLVFFGFTHCPDVCPATIQKLAFIEASRAKDLAGARVVLVSVDGERDTPAALASFLGRFSANFIGLTAPPARVHEFANGFAAAFFKDPPRDGVYNVQHSTRVYVLDKQGRLRAELFDAPADSVVGVVRALAAE